MQPYSTMNTLLSVIEIIGVVVVVLVVVSLWVDVLFDVLVDVFVDVVWLLTTTWVWVSVTVVLTTTIYYWTVTNSSEIDTIKVSLVGTLYLIEYLITDPVTLFSPIIINYITVGTLPVSTIIVTVWFQYWSLWTKL